MRIIQFVLIFFSLFLLSCKEKEKGDKSGHEKKPNILLIIADDIGVYDLGCYGNKTIQTPHIDDLAKQGLQFNQAFLTTSSCSPSRVSIITGRYPHNTGAAELHSPLPEHQILFPEVLKAQGYYTAQAGKWHFGTVPMVKGDRPVDTAQLGPAVRAFDRISVKWEDNGDGGENQWVRFLRERPKDKPFFMWFAAYDAHRPWGVNQFKGANNADSVWVPDFLYDGPETRKDLAHYYDEITRFDYYVGEVLKELNRQGIADNTLVIITSDNGRPFPRSKTRMYDSGIKTPLIVFWPKGIAHPGKVEAMVSTVDLAPTILKVAGIEPGKTFQGRSFSKLFLHPDEPFRNYTFSEHNWHDYEACERQVRTKDFMYIENYRPQFDMWGPADAVVSPSMKELYEAYQKGLLNEFQTDVFKKPRPKTEFYQVQKDPFQFYNLSRKDIFAGDKKRLQEVLKDWRKQTADDCPEHLTPDHFDRKTGKRLFKGFRWGVMPGKMSGADTVTKKGPF